MIPKPSSYQQVLTTMGVLGAFHQWFMVAEGAFSKHIFGTALGAASFGGFSWLSDYLERKRSIAQIHLIQHPSNKDYAQEVLLVKANGEEL
jgi:hypothetical protein